MPATRSRRRALPSLAALVEATQAELATTAQVLRGHASRLGTLRRQLRASIPARRFERAVSTFDHTLATALAAGLDAHLADELVPAIIGLEASARASEAEPFPLPEAHEVVLVDLLGRKDSLVAVLAPRQPSPHSQKGHSMPGTTPALKLKSERIQSPGSWEFSTDQGSASARFEFGSRRGAVAFIGLASELAERSAVRVGFLLSDASAVRVTIVAAGGQVTTGGTFSERELELVGAFNRLVGEEVSL